MKKTVFLSALMLFACSSVSAVQISAKNAKQLYTYYLYHGGARLSKEELAKYLLEPRSRQLQSEEKDTPWIGQAIAKNPRYDTEEKKAKAWQNWLEAMDQNRAMISLLESDPISGIKDVETLLGPAEVKDLQKFSRWEKERIEKEIASSIDIKPFLCARDLPQLKKELQLYADYWTDERKPRRYGGTHADHLLSRRHGFVAFELLKRLDEDPQETIRYLCEGEKPTLARAQELIDEVGSHETAEKMLKKLQNDPATAERASAMLQELLHKRGKI